MHEKKTIMRVIKDKENPYLMVNKASLLDSNLSAKAKGIHLYLLSLPDDWKIYIEELTNHFADGRDSIRSGIQELIEKRYVIRKRLQNEKGQFCGYEYLVFEVSQEEPQKHDAEPTSSVNGKSESGFTENGKPATTKYLYKQNNDKQNSNQSVSPVKQKTENENLTDRQMDIPPDEIELRELERILKNGQTSLFHSRLFIESVIKKLYTDGQMPYILKMGLLHAEIQNRLRLLTHRHIDWALAKMSNVKSNKELYFAKCLLTAIVEVDIDEMLDNVADEDESEPVAPDTRNIPKRDNFEQRKYTDEDFEGLYVNLAEATSTTTGEENSAVLSEGKQTEENTLLYTRFVEVEQPVCEAYPNPFLGTSALE